MKLKKIFASLLSLGLILSPIRVFADDDIVAVASDNSAYTSYKGAWAAATSGLKVSMLQDWNISSRLVVPEGANVTVEMNGCKINRNLGSECEMDGEVIYLSKNSTLTLSGENYKNTQFSFKGYDQKSNLSDQNITSGGLVTGGASSNGGGGIHMKEGSKLYLNNVAIAGNYSGQLNKEGGGININNEDCQVHMTNSIIAYNKATCGGGIYVAGENEQIVMDASSICHNYSYHEGGGIYSNKDATYITMINNSSINDNTAGQEGGGIYFDNPYCQVRSSDGTGKISNNTTSRSGGGIYFCNSSRGDTQIVENITLESNEASSCGGAIYANQEDLTIKDCILSKNYASYGGAIFVAADDTHVKDCTIQENIASKEGGGINVSNLTDVYLDGKMIVDNNLRSDASKDDVFLGKTWPSQAYISGTPSSESHVGIRCDNERKVGINQTEDNGSFFSDEDNYKITYKDGNLYKESGSVLGAVFGNANLGAAIVVIGGIAAIGVIALIISKKKNHVEA